MSNANQYKSTTTTSSSSHKFPDPISLYNTPGAIYTSSPSEDLDDEDYPDDYLFNASNNNNNNNNNGRYHTQQQQQGQGMYYQLQHQAVTSPHSPAIHTQQQQQFYGSYLQIQHPHLSSPSPSSPSTVINSSLPFAKKPDCMFYVKVKKSDQIKSKKHFKK